MLMRCGPHQTNMGKRDDMQMPTAISRLCGQDSRGPSGLDTQSYVARRCCIGVGEGIPGLTGATGGRSGAMSEVIERPGVLDQDPAAARLVPRPFVEQVEEQRVVGFRVALGG